MGEQNYLEMTLQAACFAHVSQLETPTLLAQENGGAFLALFENRNALSKGTCSKFSFHSASSIEQLLSTSLPRVSYNKTTDVLIIGVVCGEGEAEDEVYHHSFVYSVPIRYEGSS